MIIISIALGQQHYQYNLKPETQTLGAKISSSEITLQECQNDCDMNPNCFKFMMQVSESLCILESAGGIQLPHKDFDTYVKGNLIPASVPSPTAMATDNLVPSSTPIPIDTHIPSPVQAIEVFPSPNPSAPVLINTTRSVTSNGQTKESSDKKFKSPRSSPVTITRSNSQKSESIDNSKTPNYVYFLIIVITAVVVFIICSAYFKRIQSKSEFDDCTQQLKPKFSYFSSKLFDTFFITDKVHSKTFTDYNTSHYDNRYTPNGFAVQDDTLTRSDAILSQYDYNRTSFLPSDEKVFALNGSNATYVEMEEDQ